MEKFFLKLKGALRGTGSVAAGWAVSYLLILLIPTASAVFSFFYTTSTIKEEITGANQLVLSNLQDGIDKLMKDELAAYAFLYTNPQLADLTRSSTSDAQFHYSAAHFTKLLSSYSALDPALGILIYLKEKDVLLSAKTVNETSFLYGAQKTENPAFLPAADWSALLEKDYQNEFFISNALNLYQYANSLLYGSTTVFAGGASANLFISFPLSRIASMTAHLSEGMLVLAGEDGTPLAAFDHSGETTLPNGISRIPFSEEGESIWEQEITGEGGHSFICTSTSSKQSPWRFAILTPEKVFWKKVSYCTTLHIASLLTALVLGLLSAFLLLRKNYRPISGILSLLDGSGTEGNEFDRFRAAYARLHDENLTMKDALERQQETLRENYLLSCLKGRGSKIPEAESDAFFELSIHNSYFGLTAFSALPPDHTEEDFDELAIFAVDNTFRELMGEYPALYKIEDGRFLYYLFVLSPEQKDGWETVCYERLQGLCELFEDKLHISLTAAISKLQRSFPQIHTLYRDVMEALSYKSVLGGGGVLRGEDLKDPGEKLRLRREELNRSLSEAVGKGDLIEAKEIAQAILEAYEKNPCLPFTAFRLTMTDSLNAVLNVFYGTVQDHELRLAFMTQLEHLMSSPDEQSFREGFLKLLAFSCHSIRTVYEKENPDLSRQVREYIQVHYTESSLNINTIADALGRSPRRLSQVFKAETGEGMLEYLNLVRIRKAKALLKRKAVTCEELAVLVGYTNSRTFRRAFQKVEGITPGKYES